MYTGFEGTQDELSFLTEAQWHFSPFAYLKLNNAVGVTTKATDWAPDVGSMFLLRTACPSAVKDMDPLDFILRLARNRC